MIKVIENMPVGTIGLEASGEVTEDDYRDVLQPTLGSAVERGDVRLLYVLDKGVKYSPGAMWADTKLGAKNWSDWKRLAVVTDADWIEHAIKAFAWMIPGEVKVFELDEIHDAKAWLVGLDDD